MKTLFTGQNYTLLSAVDSTNSYAADLLKTNTVTEGSVFCSFNQLNGRGQRGNEWFTQPNNNIALSIVLHPSFLSPDKQFFLTKAISLAMADLMTELLNNEQNSHTVNIKWPNDIYINKKKIAGILIENTLSEGLIKNSIVGIGLNVNQTAFSTELTNATSLYLLTGKTFELPALVEKICEYVEARYLQLKANKTTLLSSDYLSYLYQRNEQKKYSSFNTVFEGRISGVNESGMLQIIASSGELKEFSLKEIKYL